MQKLNVGCGRDYREGYINLDISDAVGADVVADMADGLPFEDNRFDEVVVQNALTQIQEPYLFVHVMNELHRVTKGVLIVRVPNAKDICAWQDPMDCRRFTDQTFTYMEYGHRRYNQYGKHYGFKPYRVELQEDNGRQMTFHLWPIKD
jgi:predicted SAM-dependent methyltransferase